MVWDEEEWWWLLQPRKVVHYPLAPVESPLMTALSSSSSTDCSDAAAKIGEEAGDFVEACLPEHPGFAGAVAGKLEAAL